MGAAALGLTLAAALLHATWNLLLAGASDTRAATAVALVAGQLIFAPVALLTWDVHRAAIPFIVASGLLELLYIALLAAAYERGPLSVVYPVARGTAPVLVLGASAALLGIRPSAAEVVGILAIAAGVLVVRGFSGDVSLRQLALPLGVAATIASYTLVDRSGIQHASAIAYFELSGLITLAYPAFVAVRGGLAPLRAAVGLRPIVAGAGMFGAYALVLAALRIASPGAVAAVRETSVVLATALAAVFLREHVSRGRLAGAALVAGGVAVLALG